MTRAKDTARKGTFCPDCGHWNKPELKSCEDCKLPLPVRRHPTIESINKIGPLIGLAGLIVAFLALLPAAFQAYEAHQTTTIAQGDLRPLLKTEFYHDDNGGGALILRNYGKGTAIITDVKFVRSNMSSRNIIDVIDHHNAPYRYRLFGNGTTSSIESGGSKILAQLTLIDFIDNGIRNKTQIDENIGAWTESVIQTNVQIDYEDVLGKKYYTNLE